MRCHFATCKSRPCVAPTPTSESANRVPDKPTTLGEHIRRRRLELHMLQIHVADLLRANRISVQNWERGVYEPAPRFLPVIIQFLGYDPKAKP